METKVVLFIIYLTLGIISSIIYLIYCYKKYEVLTLADIIASLLIISGWPVVLLFLAAHYFLLFLSNLEEIRILEKK
jgi:hypothetical protein